MSTSTILALAGTQHGALGYDQARAAGISRSGLHRAVASGVLSAAAPEVYVVAGYPRTRSRDITVACLTYGGVASHQTAAGLWDLLDPRDDRIHVLTRRWDRVIRPDLVVHESRDLIDDDVEILDGIPVTTPARTVVDLGAEVAPQAVEIALETGIRRRLFTIDDVAGFVKRVGRPGRRGVGAVRPLLDQRARWDGLTESALEDRFRRILAGASVPLPVPQFVVRGSDGGFICRADFAYPEARVLIELDSERHHMDRLTFRRDRAKQNRVALEGWTVLRYTWFDLSDRPWDVCTEISSLVSSAYLSRAVRD